MSALGPPLFKSPRASGSVSCGDLRARAWALLIIDAASQNGLTPISKVRFHRLAYLTNALAPLYGVRALDMRIVKFERGQFYPDLQWHLDRLAVQGLIKMSGIRHFVDADGPWMEANYKLAKAAVSILALIAALNEIREISSFLLEVTKAYASQQDEALDDLILEDVTYDDVMRARGEVIDFTQARDNLSVLAAESFADVSRRPQLVSRSDKVHFYVEYMDRVWLRRQRA